MDVTRDYIDLPTCQKLVCAVVEQAVEDYRALERNGIVQGGSLVPGSVAQRHLDGRMKSNGLGHTYRVKRLCRGVNTEHDVQLLLRFLWRDVDLLLSAANIELTLESVHRGLGFPVRESNPPARGEKLT